MLNILQNLSYHSGHGHASYTSSFLFSIVSKGEFDDVTAVNQIYSNRAHKSQRWQCDRLWCYDAQMNDQSKWRGQNLSPKERMKQKSSKIFISGLVFRERTVFIRETIDYWTSTDCHASRDVSALCLRCRLHLELIHHLKYCEVINTYRYIHRPLEALRASVGQRYNSPAAHDRLIQFTYWVCSWHLSKPI